MRPLQNSARRRMPKGFDSNSNVEVKKSKYAPLISLLSWLACSRIHALRPETQ
jgi:hypothetical protein